MTAETTTAARRPLAILTTWVVQFVATVGLLLFAYWWLLWPDERAWQVGASLATAAIAILFALWLECATLAFFGERDRTIFAAFRRSFRRLPAFVLWAIVFALLLWGVHLFQSTVPAISVRIAQVFGARSRIVTRWLTCFVMALQWVIIPAVLLPIASRISSSGLRGWRLTVPWRSLKRGSYWAGYCVALIVGAYIPYKLIRWVPNPSTLRREAWSMSLRFTAAYVLVITAWVFLAWLLGRDNEVPAAAGERTVELPAAGGALSQS